jgi:hypothetical protein
MRSFRKFKAANEEKNIRVEEVRRSTKQVPGVHLTGWNLYYALPNGKTLKRFYQKGNYWLEKAKHEFYKTTIASHLEELKEAKEENQ